MDFEKIVKFTGAMTCVISIEKLPEGKYGKIRIVAGNDAYIESLEHPMDQMHMKNSGFVPNMEYTDLMETDLNFEHAVYQAAINKKLVHNYVKPDRHDVWLNMAFMPIMYEEGNLYFCTYTMEIDLTPDTATLANVSGDIAASVLETCVIFRSGHSFEEAMTEVVQKIREMCRAEKCVVLLMNNEEQSCRVLGESLSPDTKLSPLGDYADGGFYQMARTWESTIDGSNCLMIVTENDKEFVKEKNLPWYESLIVRGIQTVVIMPLEANGKILGYIWVDNFNPDYSERIKETLEITTFILSSETANYLLLNRLETLGCRDMLTGVLNRNEMNNVVGRLASEEEGKGDSLGVIFADLNGLKVINDTAGHTAGDNIIKNAAKILSDVFEDNQVFRAGGDEFSIILLNTSEEEVAKKVEQVRKMSEDYDGISFALGSCVVERHKDIRVALRKADEQMYLDKKKYYEAHPEMRRGVRIERLH